MDYASEVDADAEKAVIKELRSAPTPTTPCSARKAADRPARTARYTWVIDPLDGTSNYLRGFPH